MNITRYFIFSLVLLGTGLPKKIMAQKVSGKWYGVGMVDVAQATNNYLCELLLNQDGNNNVTGEFNYYFRNGYFSNKVQGTFKLDSRFMYIHLVPVMYNRTVNTLIGVDCPMHGEFVLKVSRAETTLSGNFLSDGLHQYTCAPLKVNFLKLLNNEPTLKERVAQLNKEDTTQDSVVVAAAPPPPLPVKPKEPEIATTQNVAKDAEQKVQMRLNNLVRVIDVSDDSVRIDLYDNGILDYDTATVFFNKKMVQYKRLLDTRRPISFYVHVDPVETNNDLVMYADNLGLIPPNSALMIVTDKEHRYEISLTSDFQKNAAVRLRKAKKPEMRAN